MQPDYSGKKILFTAFSMSDGSEELAGYEFFKRHGGTDISALYWGDEEYAKRIPSDVKTTRIDGDNHFDPELTRGDDLVFRHQTTRPDLVLSPSTTNTNEFFKHCDKPIIAVTGTKGKGTTATLISEILDRAGIKNALLGNMGNTAIAELDALDDERVVVFEISSFQLWDIDHSPAVAVVLMMEIEHQDVHSSADDYIDAKSRIVRFQTADDLVVYHPTNKMTQRVVESAASRHKRYLTAEGAHIDGDIIKIDDQEILPVRDVGLLGGHNLENICAAITAAWEFTQNKQAIARAVHGFKGLEHRLEYVLTVDGIDFYNDSFSTAPVATIAAVKSFTKPITLIVGGYDRGLDLTHLTEEIANSNVSQVLAIGDIRRRLSDALQAAGFESVSVLDPCPMDEMVNQAIDKTSRGSTILLSPGCASFDMCNNYKERGKQYKNSVKNL